MGISFFTVKAALEFTKVTYNFFDKAIIFEKLSRSYSYIINHIELIIIRAMY